MNEKGVIKFKGNWIPKDALPESSVYELNLWRQKLYNLGLIGATNEGIGFGNISIRYKQNHFIISGTATGKIERLSSSHYTLVTAFDINENCLTAEGPIMASSESLTHAVIYQQNPEINAVIHIHHMGLWKELLDKVPATNPSVEYGTPEMAKEIIRLFNETDIMNQKILAMAGHEEGIISFGKNLEEAGLVLLKFFTKS